MSYLDAEMNIQGELYGPLTQKARAFVPNKGSRAEFQKHFRELDPKVVQLLDDGKLHLADRLIYSIKHIGSSTTIKMFESSDDKKVGLRSLAAAKLPKNEVLLVSGIYLMAGVAPAASPGSPTEAEIMATVFGSIGAANRGAIASGEFELKANKNIIVPETSNRLFVTDDMITTPLGFYKLHNPRIIMDDVTIEFTVTFGTTEAIPQDTYLFCGLFGTGTTP